MDGRISNLEQIASLRRYTLTEGTEAGLDVIDCDNGRIRFLINVDKACDLMQLYHLGQNVSFISKNGFTKRETPFLSRFEGGMLYTCGLDSVGARDGFEVHGTLHNMRARILRAEVDESQITVEAVIRDTALFGKSLALRRTITSALGSDRVRIEDSLINEGHLEESYCVLYHINLGYPMLDEGATLTVDAESIQPRTSWSKENQGAMLCAEMPVPGQEECCYFLKLRSPEATVTNQRLGKRFTLTYSGDTLPCFVEWRSMASGDYALGLEPATTELDGTFAYKTIKAGEQVSFALEMQVSSLR